MPTATAKEPKPETTVEAPKGPFRVKPGTSFELATNKAVRTKALYEKGDHIPMLGREYVAGDLIPDDEIDLEDRLRLLTINAIEPVEDIKAREAVEAEIAALRDRQAELEASIAAKASQALVTWRELRAERVKQEGKQLD